jgi:hypothetical protein
MIEDEQSNGNNVKEILLGDYITDKINNLPVLAEKIKVITFNNCFRNYVYIYLNKKNSAQKLKRKKLKNIF